MSFFVRANNHQRAYIFSMTACLFSKISIVELLICKSPDSSLNSYTAYMPDSVWRVSPMK